MFLPKASTQAKRAPAANQYSPKTYWKMDAKESVFRNSGAAIFGRDKTDILKQKYHLREMSDVPAPGKYDSNFSEFSGLPMLNKQIDSGQVELPK